MARCGALLLLTGVGAAGAVDIGGSVRESIPTELPRSAWPASTALQSNVAWPSGHQPARLEAWPQTGFGTDKRKLKPCWKVTVLHDTKEGWPGACLNLFKAEGIVSQEGCRLHCVNEPRCPVWQFNNQTYPGQCWVGFGTDCVYRRGRTAAINVQAAQRIMHGEVRVIMNLTGWKINNLWQMGLYHEGDAYVSMLRCKAWCYSTLSCDYWQYGSGGCWVDAPMYTTDKGANPQNVVQYPLTLNGGASRTSPEALTMEYGEYIQHYCPPQNPSSSADLPVVDDTEETPRKPRSFLSSWTFWLLLTIAIIALVLTICYVLMNAGGDRKRKGRRNPDYEEDKPLMQMGHSFSPDQQLYVQGTPLEKTMLSYDDPKLHAVNQNSAGLPTVDAGAVGGARQQLAPTQLVDLNQLQAMRGPPPPPTPPMWPSQAASGPLRSVPTYQFPAGGPRYG